MTECIGCEVAQRSVAETDRLHTCVICAAEWHPACDGCVEARSYLRSMRDQRSRHESSSSPTPRKDLVRIARCRDGWTICDVCGEIVALDGRGMQQALDKLVAEGDAAATRLRRKQMLLELDNLARWRPYLEGHSSEPSPIVGDGNVGGGAKTSSTDRPDWVNEDSAGLRLAYATREKLLALETRARFDAHTRAMARLSIRAAQRARGDRPDHPGPPPTLLERGVAVLQWLSERSGSAHRKDIAFRVGMAFGGRAEERQRAEGDLARRLAIAPITPEAERARRSEIDEAYRADIDAAESDRREVMRSDAYLGFARAAAIAGCDSLVSTAMAKRQRALDDLSAQVALRKQALTPAEYRSEVAKLPPMPNEEGVKLLGNELLQLADATWHGLEFRGEKLGNRASACARQ